MHLWAEEDPALDAVVAWLLAATKHDPAGYFAALVRRAIDEVIDGPRTGRWSMDQLEKTEQTYVGTKIEIVVRAALGVERGQAMDFEIAGHDVDIKWSKKSDWQIPTEAVGHLCLCVGATRNLTALKVGVVRCRPENLNLGKNKDGKTTLSAAGRADMRMLATDVPLPPNFVAEMDPAVREAVIAHQTIQARVTALAKAMPYVPIPRDAIRTIARTEGDPIRRTRSDAGRPDPLDGMVLLSARYRKAEIAALGRPPLGPDEFMAVPRADLQAHGFGAPESAST